MFRVYVGNVANQVTEETIQTLLEERGLQFTSIVLKRGYAFVDCPDQNSFEETIQQLNEISIFGSVLHVEASSISQRMKTCRLQISNLPLDMTKEDIQQLAASSNADNHTVEITHLVADGARLCAVAEYENTKFATLAYHHLNKYNLNGSLLEVEYVSDETHGTRQWSHIPATQQHPQLAQPGLPLRLLVASDYIGAVIGRNGQTIRAITSHCQARIDVHGKENTTLLEKMISIYGLLENCTDACREILKVMQQEANSKGGEVTLKMLIDDRYCGRIIGKEGKAIKKIREDTGTRITISNVQELAAIYPDRVIAIRGSIDNMSQAQAAISLKLRECYERDISNIEPSTCIQDSGVTQHGASSAYSSARSIFNASMIRA